MYLARRSSNSLLAHLGSIFSLVLPISLLHGSFVSGSPLEKRQEDASILSPRSYTPGWCGVHVVQYQKTNPSDPSSHYHLDVTIFDGAQTQIGQVLNQDAPSNQGVGVNSALPYVLIVTAQNVDDDAVLFNYADQASGSNDQQHHCNFGAYDSGSRNGDCGFSC